MKSSIAAITVLFACMGGCVATVQPDPVYAEADYAPANVETAPTVIYEGQPTYYVNDRWYVRRGPRWVYYRQPPPRLARQRPYVQAAPPAYRAREHGRRPVGPEYAAPRVRSAPRAAEVR